MSKQKKQKPRATYNQELNKHIWGLHWAHILVVSVSLIFTIVAWQFSKIQIEEKVKLQFDREADQVLGLVTERMKKYEDTLQSAVATIQTLGGDITHPEWVEYSKNLMIVDKYPGINGIGVIHNVKSSELENYLKKQRRFRPNYRVHPQHKESEYFPISYIEPVELNSKAVGLDMAHELNRYTAAKKARDTNTPQITGPITLVQDSQKTPGFLFYTPTFKDSHFVGLVYAPFVVKSLMAGTLEKDKRHVGVKLTDQQSVLYNEHTSAEPNFDPKPLFTSHKEISFYGRTWQFDIRSSKTFRAALANNQPLTILLGGLIINTLLLVLFIIISRSRNEAISYANHLTQELQTKAKDLESTSQYKTQFLANMSHELRTPMNGILGYSEILKESLEEKALFDELDDIKQIQVCGNHLYAIIQDILDISKIESGKLELNYEKLSLQQMFEEAISIVRPMADKNLNILNFEINNNLDQLSSDHTKLKQIIINLLSNAVKFTKEGRISLEANKSHVKNEEMLKITISDTGIGIPAEKLKKIFESFVQADSSTTRQYGGTGLGLHISQSFCEAMGGHIEVESQLGVGSSFNVYLPLRVPAESQNDHSAPVASKNKAA